NLAMLWLACDGAFRKCDTSRTSDPLYGTQQTDQRRQIVRAHIEHGSAAVVVVKRRVGMPALVAVAEHKCRRCNRLADGAVIDEHAAGLQSSAHKSVWSGADANSSIFRQTHQAVAIDKAHC